MSTPPPEATKCEHEVDLPGGPVVDISASLDAGADPALCPMADATLQTTLTALSSDPLPRRPTPFPPTSLATIDACGLTTAPEVAAMTRPSPRADPGYGHWRCWWSAGDARFEVRFDRDTKGTGAVDGRPLAIGGREVAQHSDGPGHCLTSVLARRYPQPEGSPSSEVVNLELRAPGAPDPCGALRAEALAVAGRLPRTS